MAASVSAVIPVCNEVDSLETLFLELAEILVQLPRAWEVIFVDDGSTDGSTEILERLAERNANVTTVVLRRNCGQSAAMAAGVAQARHDVVVFLDADLQNDPADIPMLLDHIEAGFDLVFGWRKNRRDRWLSRRIPSQVANAMISRVCRFPARDLGCGLKAIRRELAIELPLTTGMHRFLPILAAARGARCREVPVNHRPRRFGRSKYGLDRIFRVIPDLMAVRLHSQPPRRPLRWFGIPGLVLTSAALVFAAAAVVTHMNGAALGTNPWKYAAIGTGFLGLQAFGFGVLGEIVLQHATGSVGRPAYDVRRVVESTSSSSSWTIKFRRAA